ncbi:hypothetical protein M8J75_012084 [Diaphorina citri]|nr:hypothetical protein M8J75_012084 [Diaphorina citri]
METHEIHRDQLQHNREDTGVRADPGTDVSNNSIHIELVQDKFTVVEPGTLSVDTAAKYGEVKPRTGQPKSKRYTVSGSADKDHLLASTLRNLAPGCIATPEEIWNNEVEATQRQIYYMTMRQNVHLLESYTPQRRLETAHGSPPSPVLPPPVALAPPIPPPPSSSSCRSASSSSGPPCLIFRRYLHFADNHSSEGTEDRYFKPQSSSTDCCIKISGDNEI